MFKYRNKPTVVDGIRFDSKKEALRYEELKILKRAGQIVTLQTHVAYPLKVAGTKVGSYEADFVYLTSEGKDIIEDCKGFRTPLYKFKKKVFEAIYGVRITET